ncbi:MAG TPA: glycosyl hydrolase family 8, partial [Rhodoblastus sp.]|nr:glycosyl hydrolase family 8 [Rhodoblastus sp.]
MDQPRGGRDVRIGEVIAGSPVWSEWSRRYVRPSGRVVDTGARGASHSEGQGYGMLLAVAAGDRPAFDRIWGWARANLAVRSDNLLAWRWDPGARAVSDRNNATDGDILAAWALAEAADLWRESDYAAAATAMAADISRLLVVDAVGVGPVLLPASFGFTRADQPDGPVVNLSYWVFPAFSRLAQLAPAQDWEGVRRSGLAVIDAIQSQTSVGVTNWTALGDSRIAPARRFPAKVGYDAVRIPLYLAFAPRENAERLARFAGMFPAAGLPIVDLRSGETEEVATGRGYRAIAALRACVVAGQPFPRDFYGLGDDEPYYPATLHMLSLIAALASHSECLDAAEASRLQPLGWTRRLAGDISVRTPSRADALRRPPVANPIPAAVLAQAPDAQENNEATGGIFKVGAPIGALLALVGFIAVSRRSKAPAFVEDITPTVLRERSPAPRHLPENPFNTARGERALEERLDIAAKASWDWQRTA